MLKNIETGEIKYVRFIRFKLNLLSYDKAPERKV